jgi:hypothetical protein
MGADPQNVENPRDGRARRPWWRRILLGVGVLVTVLALSFAAAVQFGVGRDLTVPDWLRDRITSRIERNLDGLQLDFRSLSFVVNKGWRPRVRLQDVVLTREGGTVLAQLAHAEAALAMRPLLKGNVQPKAIILNGAYGQLRRDADGQIALSIGDQAAPVGQAASLPELIARWDSFLLRPELSALVSVDLEALTLRYEDLRKGRAWTLDGGRLHLDRDGDDLRISAGFSVLSGRDYASAVEATYASRIGETEAEVSVVVDEIASGDIAAQNVALEWLNVLRAPISGALRGAVLGDGTLGPVSATLQIGEGLLQPSDVEKPVPFSGARSYFTYDPAEQVLEFDELSLESGWGKGAAEGRAYLNTDGRGNLTDLVGQFRFHGIEALPGKVFEEPLPVDQLTADFRLELVPFRFTLGEALVTSGETSALLGGDLTVEDGKWVYALDAGIETTVVEEVLRLWPPVLAPKPRKWVAENLQAGTLRDGRLALRGRSGTRPDIGAGFVFEDARIRFLRTMPPIEQGQGHVTLVDGRFVVTATGGQVTADEGGQIDVAGTSFIIPEIRIKKAAPAVVRMTGKGSVTSVLSLLNRPPLQVLRATTLPVDMVQGQAMVQGTLSLPLREKVPFEDIRFHFAGEVGAVSSAVLVPGYDLTSDRMQVTGDQTGVRVYGTGSLAGVPVTAEWGRAIGKGVSPDSQVKGQIELSQKTVDTFNIGLPPGTVSGRGQGVFTLDLRPGEPPALTASSDLAGIGLRLPELGWAKSQNSTGRLELSGRLGDQVRLDRLALDAAGLSATGTVSNRTGGGLDRASFGSVRLGGWLDAAVELVGRGGAATPLVRILSGSVDLRRAPFGEAGGSGNGTSGSSGPMQVALDRLQITDSMALTGFQGDFSTQGGFNGKFSGRLNGGTPVNGVVVPQEGGSAYRLTSDDAGGIFRDSGILAYGHGGSFDMTLLPAGPGEFEGKLAVRDTRVRDGPAIAALLNAISLVGLIDEMAGNGIQFQSVNARFRLGPSLVTVYESSAEGPSIGISMDGTYDLERGRLNMRGVVSPFYLLNAIGSLVTRRGEGVFGFNYRLTGPASDPSVQVNPLSSLAPAMLRDIFRTPGPKAPAVGGGATGAPPEESQDSPSPRKNLAEDR